MNDNNYATNSSIHFATPDIITFLMSMVTERNQSQCLSHYWWSIRTIWYGCQAAKHRLVIC